jgi:hypothetical protein
MVYLLPVTRYSRFSHRWNGPEVVLAAMPARRRPAAKMTFDTLTLIFHIAISSRWPFCLSLTFKMLFKCIHLAENLVCEFQKLAFLGVLNPKFYFMSMSKGTSFQRTALFEPPCVQIGSAYGLHGHARKNVKYSKAKIIIYYWQKLSLQPLWKLYDTARDLDL